MAQVSIDIVAAVDDAIAGLNRVDGQLDGMSSTSQHAGISMSELNNAMEAGQKVYAAVEQALEKTVGKTVEYAGQVRDLSRAMGGSAEDASVLIQAGSDIGISFDTLKTATKKLNQEGIQPSIANLGDMADEYLRIPDPVARAQFAIDKFGLRAGPEMQKLLEKGSDGLDEMAASAREAGQVLSGETVAAARELEIGLDNLNDMGEGLALTVGSELLPVITDLVKIGEQAAPVVHTLAEGFVDAWEAGEQLHKIIALTMLQFAAFVEGADEATVAHAAMMIVNDGLTDSEVRAADALSRSTELILTNTGAVEDATGAVAGLKTAQSDLALAIEGPIANAQDEYYQKQKDAGAVIVDTQNRIKELTALPQLTDQQRTELGELQTLLDTQKQTYADNATAHEESTARIVFSMLTQRLAMDGFTKEEMGFLTDVGEAWGIYDQKTASVLRSVDGALSTHGLNADAVIMSLDSHVRNLPERKLIEIEVRTNYTQYGAEPGPGAPVVVPETPYQLPPGGVM